MRKLSFFILVGGFAFFAGILFSCDRENDNLPPVADFDIKPYAGNTETIFTFDCSGSSDDKDSLETLLFRWDWQDDGRWDTDWSSSTIATHRFTVGGTYKINLEVKDSEGAVTIYFELLGIDEFFLVDSRDRKEYTTVHIGEQMWMAENLQYDTMFESWCFNDSVENCEEYGRLYSWNSAQSACPSGWKLPSQSDWEQLIKYVGENPGDKLRSLTGWNAGLNGTDSYGFNAKPASFRRNYGEYSATDGYAYFWTSDSYSQDMGYTYLMFYNESDIRLSYISKQSGFSIRCVAN